MLQMNLEGFQMDTVDTVGEYDMRGFNFRDGFLLYSWRLSSCTSCYFTCSSRFYGAREAETARVSAVLAF